MMAPSGTSASGLDAFLTEIVESIRKKNGSRITDLFQLDFDSLTPARRKPYEDLNQELNQKYAPGNDGGLTNRVKRPFSQDEFGIFSNSFSECVLSYFRYLRDFSTADNQAKATKIRQLTSQCVVALGDSTYGVIMLPIVLSFSRVLAAIATNLDRNPSLIRDSSLLQTQDSEGAAGRVSFVEDAANVLREAFIKCLVGGAGVQRTSRPDADDKRIGIYLTANSALKLFMRSRKLRNAQQIFNSIDAQSPPLSYYPAAQRITYLYYLGRYHFANNHFPRAQKVLQTAYDQCHRGALKHRRLILIYLMASNTILGRFPSSALLSRPEAVDIGARFAPLCQIIRNGDLGLFQEYFSLDSESGQWFLTKSLLFQLRNRCEVLVWRSLIRKCYIFIGFTGEGNKLPVIRLEHVQRAARWTLARRKAVEDWEPNSGYVDPEFAGMDEAFNETGFDPETGQYHDDAIGEYEPEAEPAESPTMNEVESVVLSLIQQGLLKGFAVHAVPRFALPTREGGPLKNGFPQVWSVIESNSSGGPTPGWVQEENLG